MDAAFGQRQSLGAYPLRLIWLELDQAPPQGQAPVQVAFSIPKKRVKLAVHRHRLKRQLREIYRLNKAELMLHQSTRQKQLALIWLYVGAEKPDFATLDKKGQQLLQQLSEKQQNATNLHNAPIPPPQTKTD